MLTGMHVKMNIFKLKILEIILCNIYIKGLKGFNYACIEKIGIFDLKIM